MAKKTKKIIEPPRVLHTPSIFNILLWRTLITDDIRNIIWEILCAHTHPEMCLYELENEPARMHVDEIERQLNE
jgi:hypothetical protein